jgi:hypothetical protein
MPKVSRVRRALPGSCERGTVADEARGVGWCFAGIRCFVMAGLVPAIHVLGHEERKTGMRGTNPHDDVDRSRVIQNVARAPTKTASGGAGLSERGLLSPRNDTLLG